MKESLKPTRIIYTETKNIYLLDRNVVSIIKRAVEGKVETEEKKIGMLKYLREIDRRNSAITPILSLIEGEKGREDSYKEKSMCLEKETEVIRLFFNNASTDADYLQSNASQFSATFTEYIEEKFDTYESFLRSAFVILENKISKVKRLDARNKIINIAKKQGIDLIHPAVVSCLSCLYGSEDARHVLKPKEHLENAYNPLSDLLLVFRVNLIKAVVESSGFVMLRVSFLTLDEGLKGFMGGISLQSLGLTNDSFNQKIKYQKILFPDLSDDDYHALFLEILGD
jgi:hypothetical protein